ncbi:purine and uridine phosphorylase [Penicillium verhagenii]|nr:purine and uridine phosphorylase [Penicillium verhagenii]
MSNRRQLTYDDYHVGWISLRPQEYTAAAAMLDEKHLPLLNPRKDHNRYTLGSIAGHNVVIACLESGDTGMIAASYSSAWMTITFPNIQFGLSVGIGGGMASAKVQLGDVVVSQPISQYSGVVQYARGKTNPDGFEITGALNRPHRLLLNAVGSLRSDYDAAGSRIPEFIGKVERAYPRLVQSGYTSSEALEDPLFSPRRETQRQTGMGLVNSANTFSNFLGMGSYAPGTGSAASSGSKRASGDVRIHYGLVASGLSVPKDAATRDRLNDRFQGKILCFETEAAGLMNDFPCIVVKGICSYADSGKDRGWQEYAALVAAAYTKELLHHVQPYQIHCNVCRR